MRQCYRISVFLLIFLTCIAPWVDRPMALGEGEQSNEATVSFRWAIGGLVNTGQGRVLVPITRDTTLKTGDRLKMYLELRSKCHVYLIYLSSAREMSLLFPPDLPPSGSDVFISKGHYLPERGQWFVLTEPPGEETFFLLASAKRLDALERLITDHRMAESEKRTELTEQILGEIRKVRERHLGFKVDPEAPSPILGQVRGLPSDADGATLDVESIAVGITARAFYGRAFTIEHR